MTEAEVRDLIDRFNAAWNDHDLDAALELVTDDCVFDSTAPAPDGERFVGADGLRKAWSPIFDNPQSHFDAEEQIFTGDRVVQLWRYTWGDGHIRGIDVFKVRDGKVAEKFSYVKG